MRLVECAAFANHKFTSLTENESHRAADAGERFRVDERLEIGGLAGTVD
jgi:hypothetical protein